MIPPLPIDDVLPEICAALAGHSAAVLVAEPGAGKTTRVPLALLDAGLAGSGKIVMLEPRRIAARAAARRMAATRGDAVGETVGYAMRHERKVSAKTRIEVVTEGLLTRRLQADPALSDVAIVIFDEFHERTLDGDLALALTLDARHGLRPDLKMLVMSATLDSARLSEFLGGAPVVDAPGRIFPVETIYGARAVAKALAEPVARAIAAALREQTGSVLAFLPGEGEIRRTAALLAEASLPAGTDIMPLYGAMSAEAQDEAIRASPEGRRKVVLATTIAETSLTIDGISAVVDCGYKRKPSFDPANGMTRLETVRVSLAAAEQRRGRAGRLGPGVCYRLWPEAEDRALAAFDLPEILEADLAPLALELAAWGVSEPSQLAWLDVPPRPAFAQARELLQNLDAIDAQGAITETGKAMARLPLHPRLAHMVVAGKRLKAGRLAADLAALLSERDLLERDGDADLAARIEALHGGRALAHRGAKERVREAARQIRAIADIDSEAEEASIGLLVALAWPDRIGQKRGGRGRFRMMGGGGAALPEHDPLAGEEFLAIATTDGKPGDQRIFLAAKLGRAEIREHFASHIEMHEVIAWDSRARMVIANRQERFGALLLEDKPLNMPDPDIVADAMLAGIREMGLAALPWSEGDRRLRARIGFLRRHFPDEGWPDLSDETLLASLDDWLKPYLAGMMRASHLERLELHPILLNLVPPSLRRRLDQLAPTRIAIPSGAEITVDYEGEGDPVVRARLQEMFGLTRTPKVAEGRVPLRLELLSPAGRPLAVTQSLETFWTNAYPHVRAEMRGRYPKHVWPEDPRQAVPVKPGKVR
ncbi:MAG: ATP-dependent helicase HrpB [Rhizobiales bacterium]|nr:ATP-dependent helicase HrpB [Hyphomicrobiales bacterium]